MYVIGTNEWDFVNVVLSKRFDVIERVQYDCNLGEATIFPNYEIADETLKEIKKRKNEILFDNIFAIGRILDKRSGKKFDVDNLKIYDLVPTDTVHKVVLDGKALKNENTSYCP